MARTEITEIFDDLSGEPDAQTYRFTWQGDAYEIDLAGENAERLETVIATFLPYARRMRKERTEPDAQQIRQWWSVHRHAVQKMLRLPYRERGVIPKRVRELYTRTQLGDISFDR